MSTGLQPHLYSLFLDCPSFLGSLGNTWFCGLKVRAPQLLFSYSKCIGFLQCKTNSHKPRRIKQLPSTAPRRGGAGFSAPGLLRLKSGCQLLPGGSWENPLPGSLGLSAAFSPFGCCSRSPFRCWLHRGGSLSLVTAAFLLMGSSGFKASNSALSPQHHRPEKTPAWHGLCDWTRPTWVTALLRISRTTDNTPFAWRGNRTTGVTVHAFTGSPKPKEGTVQGHGSPGAILSILPTSQAAGLRWGPGGTRDPI